jgi:CRP-like cAMP-binding protein
MQDANAADWNAFRRRTGVLDEDLTTLRKCAMFAPFLPDELREILIDAAVQKFPRNAVLFMQNEPAKRFYIVLEGRVKILRETADGRESVLRLFHPGESFAEASILQINGYPATAIACEDVRALGIPAERFKRQMHGNPELAMAVIAELGRKLHHFVGHVEQLTARSATERLAGFLLKMCPNDECAAAVVRLPIEKAVIAATLGMQPETFSRSLSKLRSFGVRIDGDEVSIPDVMALRRLSEGNKAPAPMDMLGAFQVAGKPN